MSPPTRDGWAARGTASTAVVCVAALMSGVSAHGSHQSAARPVPASATTELSQGVALTGDLVPGQAHRYHVDLAAGDFVAIVIEQLGLDVSVTIEAPGPTEILALNAMDDEFRPETAVAVTDVGGRYVVAVRPTLAAGRGRYRIRLDEARPTTEDNRRSVEAERAFARARQTRDPGKAATWPDALAQFQAAFDGFAALSDRRGMAKARLDIGITENYLSQPQALETGEDAVRLCREVGDQAGAARALRLVGNIRVARGDYDGAIVALDEAAATSLAIGHRSSEARGLNDAAIAYRRTGNIERAVELYERGLVLARATSDGTMEGLILNNLGVAYKTLGDYDRARELYQESLANRRAANDVRSQYHALLNLSNLYRYAGDHEKAREYSAAALEISRTTGDKVREAAALNSVGHALNARGDHAGALDHHSTALDLSRQLDDLDGLSEALTAKGRALRGLKRYDDAHDTLQEALALSRRMHSRFSERDDLDELATVARDRGNLAAANDYIEQSMVLDESLRAGITSPELRASFVASEHDRYELFIDILERRHRAEPGAGFDARALQASERARARVLLDSLLEGGVDLRQGVPADLLERERALQKQIRDTSEQLSVAVASGKAERGGAGLTQKLEALTTTYGQLNAEIRRRSPRYADVTRPQPLDTTEIQQTVLDPETVLLEFALGEERSWLWAVTTDSLEMFPLPPRPEIERAGRSLYERLTARQPRKGETAAAAGQRIAVADRQRASEAQALSRMLLGHVAARLAGDWRGKRLAIVTAGVLDALPFTALPMPTADSTGAPSSLAPGARPEWLGAQHEIVRLPSASVVAALRRDPTSRPAPTKTLAILADPVFERDDPRVKVGGTAASNGAPAPTVVARHALGRAGVGRLPFSREEAETIAALVPRAQVFKATDFEATRDAAIGSALQGYRIVHFATHGVFDSERPALSGLVFSLVNPRGGFRDGYLRLHDIYNVQLDAELVVISACQTALGKEIRGEGLVGLARAFMYAGAPRIVASLWEVSDLATAELMKRFYRGMLEQKLRPAAALHAAQRQMQADPRWREPFYWAGFTLVGDWR